MRILLMTCALWLAAVPAAAQGQGDGWAALARPGVVLLMRHALAPGTGDPSGFDVEDCATQRNLDASGREQARRAGAALRARGIAVDRVWTSQWCRCRETAELLDQGAPVEKPFLNSFFENRSAGPAQTQDLRAAIAGLPDDARPIMVTHQVNITALTGVFPRSGEIVAVEHAPDGGILVVGQVLVAP